MFEGKKGFEDIAEFVKALKEYFSLKNKVLWEGTAAKGATITVNNLSKYSIAEIHTTYGNGFVNPQSKFIRISHGDHEGGSADTPINGYVYGAINGDKMTISHCLYIVHNPAASHSSIYQMNVTKVIGIDPVIPEALKKYLGGGIEKRWLYAVSKKVFKGCWTVHKKAFRGYLKHVRKPNIYNTGAGYSTKQSDNKRRWLHCHGSLGVCTDCINHQCGYGWERLLDIAHWFSKTSTLLGGLGGKLSVHACSCECFHFKRQRKHVNYLWKPIFTGRKSAYCVGILHDLITDWGCCHV